MAISRTSNAETLLELLTIEWKFAAEALGHIWVTSYPTPNCHEWRTWSNTKTNKTSNISLFHLLLTSVCPSVTPFRMKLRRYFFHKWKQGLGIEQEQVKLFVTRCFMIAGCASELEDSKMVAALWHSLLGTPKIDAISWMGCFSVALWFHEY